MHLSWEEGTCIAPAFSGDGWKAVPRKETVPVGHPAWSDTNIGASQPRTNAVTRITLGDQERISQMPEQHIPGNPIGDMTSWEPGLRLYFNLGDIIEWHNPDHSIQWTNPNRLSDPDYVAQPSVQQFLHQEELRYHTAAPSSLELCKRHLCLLWSHQAVRHRNWICTTRPRGTKQCWLCVIEIEG